MIKPGDLVEIRDPFWHNGTNLGFRRGIVISTTGHILVNIKSYDSNPVKCFQYEIERIEEQPPEVSEDIMNIIWGDDYDLFRT